LPLTLIGVVLAILGVGGVFFLTSLGGGARGVLTGPGVNIVTAKHTINFRDVIGDADVTLTSVPASAVPPQAYTSIGQVKGLTAEITIIQGQAITGNLLAKSPDEVTGAQIAHLPIAQGFVAFAIPTGEQQGVAGNINNGDYIAIIVTLNNAGKKVNATVFSDVYVLRVGPASGQGPVAPGATPPPVQAGGIASSLTVEVTECQAEYIQWFLENGAVKYTLESPKDYRPTPATLDPACANATAAIPLVVTQTDIAAKWPRLVAAGA
jgi:Flp pilus assembly protein CpaB